MPQLPRYGKVRALCLFGKCHWQWRRRSSTLLEAGCRRRFDFVFFFCEVFRAMV